MLPGGKNPGGLSGIRTWSRTRVHLVSRLTWRAFQGIVQRKKA